MKPGEIRYTAREFTLGPRSTGWGIYDRERASWPVEHAHLKVPRRFDTERDAQAWADERLNAPGVAVTLPARPAIRRKRAS